MLHQVKILRKRKMFLNVNISAIIHVSFFLEIRYQQSYTLPVSFTIHSLFYTFIQGGLDRCTHQAREGGTCTSPLLGNTGHYARTNQTVHLTEHACVWIVGITSMMCWDVDEFSSSL